jgi:hypothetical protein
MSAQSIARRVLLAIAVLLMLGLGWTGVSGGVRQVAEVETFGQAVQTLAQFALGSLAIPAALTLYWARRLRAVILRCWEVSVAAAGGLAPVVWADTSIAIGRIAAGAAFFLAWGITCLVRIGSRDLVPV